jgi:hypothetical protein
MKGSIGFIAMMLGVALGYVADYVWEFKQIESEWFQEQKKALADANGPAAKTPDKLVITPEDNKVSAVGFDGGSTGGMTQGAGV